MKPCPRCNKTMMELRSQNERVCTGKDCGHSEKWTLKDGQESLIKAQR